MLSGIKIQAGKRQKFIASPLDKISKKIPFSFRQLNSLSKNLKIFQKALKMRVEMLFKLYTSEPY